MEPREKCRSSNKILFTGATHHSITGGSLAACSTAPRGPRARADHPADARDAVPGD